jgi:hypothetical protein
MGGYYSTFVSNTNSLHMAQYYNVKEGRIFWINGCNHSQLETVSPDQIAKYIDCRTLRQSQVPSISAEAMRSTMQELCNEEAFGIMDL